MYAYIYIIPHYTTLHGSMRFHLHIYELTLSSAKHLSVYLWYIIMSVFLCLCVCLFRNDNDKLDKIANDRISCSFIVIFMFIIS